MIKNVLMVLAFGFVAGAAVGYYFGYDSGWEKAIRARSGRAGSQNRQG